MPNLVLRVGLSPSRKRVPAAEKVLHHAVHVVEARGEERVIEEAAAAKQAGRPPSLLSTAAHRDIRRMLLPIRPLLRAPIEDSHSIMTS